MYIYINTIYIYTIEINAAYLFMHIWFFCWLTCCIFHMCEKKGTEEENEVSSDTSYSNKYFHKVSYGDNFSVFHKGRANKCYVLLISSLAKQILFVCCLIFKIVLVRLLNELNNKTTYVVYFKTMETIAEHVNVIYV